MIVDTLKPAEDGDGVIVRLYESYGSHAITSLEILQEVVDVQRCDLLEQPWVDDAEPAAAPIRRSSGSRVKLWLRPFEVVTLRLR